MRVALCCLAKNEQLYINDFVKWYVSIGVDTIYIYDNDNLGSKSIKEYIDIGLHNHIKVIDIKGRKEKHMQQKVYTQFYKEYGNKFDWCIFCDIDEYLMGVANLKHLLKLPIYRNYNQIRVKWRLFGDDDLISRDMSKPPYKVFKKVITHSLMRDLLTIGNLESQGKFIIRGGLHNIAITSPHFASYGARYNLVESCLPSGRKCLSYVVINEKYDYENIYFNHYMTKSLSEFINQKMGRNDAVSPHNIDMTYYWRINEPTKAKIEYLKNIGIENLGIDTFM